MKFPEKIIIVIMFNFLFFVSAKTENKEALRPVIDLSGTWQFQLDTSKSGIENELFSKSFADNITLPGTLDENKKGYLNKDTTDAHLNRIYVYEGPTWFKKEVTIPDGWEGKNIELIIERTKVTHLWVDGDYIGSNNNIFSRQVYNLTNKLSYGPHLITIMVDNTLKLVPVEGSHAYSEDTQTNWNGIIGKFYLEASNKTRLEKIRVYPDTKSKQVKLKFKIENPEAAGVNYSVDVHAELWNSEVKQKIPVKNFTITQSKNKPAYEIVYPMGDDAKLWSEFDPALYKLTVTLKSNTQAIDNCEINFGLRDFKTNGKQFAINGAATFLRGKHDAAVFPLTGYPPMDTTGWLRVFRIARSYGINFYRFHTWCPPEAAFLAADMAGIYMQPELPVWWGFKPEDSTHIPFLIKEGKNIMDNYANHASFVMFALGNEISQDRKYLKLMVDELHEYDDRPLYAQGSNNRFWDPSYPEGDDFFTTFRTSTGREDLSSDVRMSVSFLDSKFGDGGIINTFYPSTGYTFEKAIKDIPVPVIGFEVGQYSIYPNYDEMKKYTGVLKPWNLGLFRKRLAEKGMPDQADDFFRASGALSVICYREDIEAAIRTPGFGGFQLLDLQDYPGQGTALVGMLDAFMDSKGLISPDEFRNFCNDVVPLLVMDKYCWTNNETFTGEIQIANYGRSELKNKSITWNILEDGKIIYSGSVNVNSILQGSVTSAGKFSIKLNSFTSASRADIVISMDGEAHNNKYPVWIYPAMLESKTTTDIKVVTKIDDEAMNVLKTGGKVLLFSSLDSIPKNSVGGQFIPEFWNYGMFTSLAKQYGGRISVGTMGLLTDPKHKIFEYFPTEFHSNWQWWSIVKNSNPIILDSTNLNYRPIVQVIDNINRNHKLGLIFEFKVGKGKLLVCSSNLPEIEKPEARQLFYSLLKYMGSDKFNPAEEISWINLVRIFK